MRNLHLTTRRKSWRRHCLGPEAHNRGSPTRLKARNNSGQMQILRCCPVLPIAMGALRQVIENKNHYFALARS